LGGAQEGDEMRAIRIVAFSLNLLLLFTTGVFIVQRGTRWEEAPIILLMTTVLLASMLAILEMNRRRI
jgi:protein-S-isoprenylcysteine O-methyltransferase Ste14